MPRRRKLSNLEREQNNPLSYGLSCIGIFWTLLSFLSLAAACVGFYLPYWLEGRITLRHGSDFTPTYIGVFRRCHYLRLTPSGLVELVMECGRYATFSDIPSQWWQIGTVTISAGCVLLLIVSVTAVFSCCLDGVMSHCLAKTMGVLQFLAGVCVAVGCILYPLGWDCAEVRNVCGPEADIFKLGDCRLSWAYFTAIGGCCGAFICSLLSCHAIRYKGYARTIMS